MIKIPIDEAALGLELSDDVVGRNGRMLLPRGTALEAGHLRVLRIWGVPEIVVVAAPGRTAAPGDVAEAVDAGLDEAAQAAVAARFAIAGRERGVAAELYRLCLKELAAPGRCPLAPARPAGPADDGPLPKAPKTAEALVAKDPSLASFPDIYFRLQEAIGDPGSSAGRIAGIIGSDPGLAASLLRLANSPFYALGRPIDSLVRAVMVIGAGELAQLALGVTVVSRFRDLPAGALTMRQAWEHAVGCGVMARVLAAQMGGQQEERFFVAGLLHDLGRLVLLRRLPRHTARAMARARQARLPLWRAEQEILGYDHAAVGRALLGHWQLSAGLAEAVGDHHGGSDMGLDAAIVHVADAAAVAAGFGANGSPYVPPVEDRAWERLGLPVAALAVALSQARRQVADIVATLLPN
jgi:HD-like signal output (HDOD) protein